MKLKFAALVLASAGAVCATPFAFGAASTMDTPVSEGRSWLPGTSQGYVGFGLGRGRLHGSCVAGFACDDHEPAFKAFTGGQINQYLAVELSYLRFGEFDRNGGDTKAHGLNLGLVGSLPVSSTVSLLGKVGTIYGRTRTSAATPLVSTGKESGFDWSYGLGAKLDLSRNWALRADWDRYKLEFPGSNDDISLYSVGLVYKF